MDFDNLDDDRREEHEIIVFPSAAPSSNPETAQESSHDDDALSQVALILEIAGGALGLLLIVIAICFALCRHEPPPDGVFRQGIAGLATMLAIIQQLRRR